MPLTALNCRHHNISSAMSSYSIWIHSRISIHKIFMACRWFAFLLHEWVLYATKQNPWVIISSPKNRFTENWILSINLFWRYINFIEFCQALMVQHMTYLFSGRYILQQKLAPWSSKHHTTIIWVILLQRKTIYDRLQTPSSAWCYPSWTEYCGCSYSRT